MSRRRVWGYLALVVVLLAAGAVAGWVVWGDDLHHRHSLVKYADDKGEPNRYYNLPDGDAQLAIGSPDRHRIVVQWRDSDGHGWTAPETVWTDDKFTAVDNTVRYGGGTVVAIQTFTPDVHNDSDIGDVHVAIVCRELTCTSDGGKGFGTEAQVTPDGSAAYLGEDEKGVQLWTADEGIHRVPWSGHPGFEYGVVSPSEPVLAPDGSLRVVTSKPARGSCTFELLAGTPGTADLISAGRTTERLRGGELSDCASYLLTYSPDWVEVHPSDHRSRTFWFVRHGDSWTTTRDDPSGLRLVDHAGGCCATSVIGFVHWNAVAFGSPDGHQIQVQTHLLGDETWSDPQGLDGALPRYRCTWLDGYEIGDGFVVLMTCHSGKVHNRYRGDAYVVAATPDLRHWESAFVTGVSKEPQVDGDRVLVGDTTWTPEDGFVTR